MRKHVAAALLFLLFTLFAAASAPEVLVAGAVPTAASRTRSSPSVASDGDGFFAVWSDDRSGSGSVIGTRITRDGRVLDPLGLLIGTSYWATQPLVVWDGAAYLVVWSASGTDGFAGTIQAVRIAPDGGFVMQPRAIAEGAAAGGLASNGTVSVVAHLAGGPSLNELGTVVLDRDGNTLHRETLAVTGQYQTAPVVAAGTSRFVVAWATQPMNERPAVKGVPLTAAGRAASFPRDLATGELASIATDGTRFTIAWTSDTFLEDVLSSRTFDGDLVPAGPKFSLLSGRQMQRPSMVWIGDHYEILTMRNAANGQSEIVSIELDGGGRPLPIRSRGHVPGDAFWQDLAAGTNGVDLLVTRPAEGPPYVRQQQMLANLYPGNTAASSAPALLSWSGNAHRDPSVASSPSGRFVAWVEQEGVFATRIDGDGNPLDGRGIPLSGTFPDGFVRAAFDGASYVVAWRDDGSIGVRWIAPLTGATVAEARWAVEGLPEIALAASADATYVAFTEAGRLRVTRIPHATHTPDAVPLDVSPEDMIAGHPAAAWNGSALLLTWTEEYASPRASPPYFYSIAIHAARVTAGLSLLDPAPLTVAAVADPDNESIGAPSVASDGADWLVVTNSNRDRNPDILARRVQHGGSVEGEAPVKIGQGVEPVVAWSGRHYIVAWKEGDESQYERPLVLAAVPRSGALAATGRALVSGGAAPSRPAIVPAGSDAMAVAYTRFSHRPEHAGVERSFFRVMNVNVLRGRVVRR